MNSQQKQLAAIAAAKRAAAQPALHFTEKTRSAIAKALLDARPPTIPGTNVILDPMARSAWYDCVTKVADVMCRGEGEALDRFNAYHFFNECGVPN